MLEIQGLRKQYPGFALEVDHLVVPSGRCVAVVGENGSGKTVLLRCIAGVARENAGTVSIAGRPLTGTHRALALSYTSAEGSFVEDLSAGDHLRLAAALSTNWDSAAADRLARQMDLDLGKPLRALSLGNRAKVGLVCGLSRRARFLLLDESLSALDAAGRAVICGELLRMKADGCGILLCSHRSEDIGTLADETVVLSGGKIVSAAGEQRSPTTGGDCQCAPAAHPAQAERHGMLQGNSRQ